ncbi:hypothetical protein [Acinetobacter ursingii]|uniref:hypothetical protein n=1 Tax=Acinetobacter ursingii TaxID=108980 RepID=UPI00124BED68|nr:hypothetical protein [Acinetobacter ursingii]
MFKAGDKVILDNGDKNIYQINHYSHIGNGYVMKCGKRAAYSLVHRKATPEEIAAGRRIDKCEVLDMADVSGNCEVRNG